MTDVHVNGKTLKWAREYRRLTVKQAARALEIRSADLLEYEEGGKLPTMGVFEKMSKAYMLPTATLVLPSPPTNIPKHPKDFRTVEGRPADLSYETLGIISRVRLYQNRLADLAEIDPEFTPLPVRRYSMRGDPGKLGEHERNLIAVSIGDQLGWYNEDDAFRKWRRIIEDQGIYVYMEKFPIDDCKGISLLDHDNLPALIINKNEDSAVAKTFSLIHEYAHILFRRPGISNRNFENVTEAFCNKFAAAFLLPEAALKRVLAQWPTSPIEWDRDEIVEAARALKVSQLAMTLRLEGLQLAPEGFYVRFKEKQFKPKKHPKKTDSGGPGYTILRIYDLGRRFPRAILSASARGTISKVDAAAILNTPEHLFNTMKARLSM